MPSNGMRSLLASTPPHKRHGGRNSSPSVATPVNNVISSLPLGNSTEGIVSGTITGMESNTQWQLVADYTATLRDVAPKSYGIRGSRIITNVILASNDLANTTYWGTGPEASITSTTQPDPFGGDTASSLLENASGWVNWPRVEQGVTLTAGKTYCHSFYIKANGRDWCYGISSLNPQSAGAEFWLDLVNGTVGTVLGILPIKARGMIDAGNGWWKYYQIFDCTVTGVAIISQGGAPGNGQKGSAYGIVPGAGVDIYNVGCYEVEAEALYPPTDPIITLADPVTTCYDHLGDGTLLRPYYAFQNTKRYDVFRPSELARSKAYILPDDLGRCIEAICTDNRRRYFKIIGGTEPVNNSTSAVAPSFPPTGTVQDGDIFWEAVGYASLMGLELAPTGAPKHPDGVVFQLDTANVLSDNQIIALDFLPDAPETKIVFQTAGTCHLDWVTSQMRWTVGAQNRQGNAGKPASSFTRCVMRMNTVNSILYNDGGMFTGATGGPVTPIGVFLGEPSAGTQLTGCILNFIVMNNSALNDSQAMTRSRFDERPSTAALFLNGPEMTSV